MMKILFYCVVAGFLGVSYSENLKGRLNFLELQVSREAFKTRTDMLELRELISILNATEHSDDGEVVESSNVLDKLSALDVKLEMFMHDQNERNVVLSKAITREKVMARSLLQVLRDLAESNTESVLEIEHVIEENEVERENSKKVWKLFEDRIKIEMSALREKAEQLDDILEHVEGGVIIRNVEKKKPCPTNWFQDTNTCYFYEKEETLNWYGARIKCDDLGGKLSEPYTAVKLLFLLSEIDGNNVWVGATDENKEGVWVWESSQQEVEFVIWQANQPNNLYDNQNCMEIGLSKMNDESCFIQNNYVCEKSVTK